MDIFLPYKTPRARIAPEVFDRGQESSVCYTASEFAFRSLIYSLLWVISGVCHDTKEEYPLYPIRAPYCHTVRATLDKGCVHENAPDRLHQLTLAVSLKVGTWRAVRLGELLIPAVEICTELQ